MTKEEFKRAYCFLKPSYFGLHKHCSAAGPKPKMPSRTSIEALAVTTTKSLCTDKLQSYRSRNQNKTAWKK